MGEPAMGKGRSMGEPAGERRTLGGYGRLARGAPTITTELAEWEPPPLGQRNTVF